MNTELDPELHDVFSAYAPRIDAEPFTATTLTALRRAERRASYGAFAGWIAMAVFAALIAPVASELIGQLGLTVARTHAQIEAVLQPWQAQAASYALAAVLLLANRRRIRALLT